MEKHYIGVDLHQAFFQACAVRGDGSRCWEDRFPRTAEGLAAFRTRCHAQVAVAVEASTPTWHFADAVHDAVGTLTIVDACRTRLKAGYAAKTDRLDARRLADALRRDSVSSIYYPPLAIRELRELVRYRHTIVHTRTKLIQRLRAVLLRQGIVDAHRLSRHDRSLDTVVLPAQAAASVAGLRRLLALTRAESVVADQAVKATAAADPIATALQQLPGLGPVLALMIRAEVGDIRRFPTGGHLASYAGLVPRVEQSAGHVRHGRITKRGSPWLRWALIEAALQGPRRSDATGRWVRRMALRKGALKARVACARQLCHEIHACWIAMA